MKRLATFLALGALTLTACQDSPTPTATAPDALEARGGGDQAASFIVVFDGGVRDAPGLARRLAAQVDGRISHTYTTAIKGFAASMSPRGAEALAGNPNVAYVEPDAEVRLFQVASWGLDRVDQRDLPLDESYTAPNDGSGANVYILDTGVNISHNDFGGRVSYIPNGSNGDFVGDGHGSAEDCHGHGTHVAGTAAGSSFGVAKGAPIWAGRVVNCSGGGQVSMAIAGVDWITANGQQPAVVNMSLGYGDVQSLRDAVENSIAAGVNYAVAAGNGNFAGIPQDACSESPAGAPNAITVGATNSSDTEASFSNYGTCVDILAPGVSITSAWIGSDNATNTISGTSMATPHVAGAVALYLTANAGASPSQVSNALTSNASQDKISLHRRSNSNGTPNLLLYTDFIGDGGGTTNSPPSASFTADCTELTCDFTDTSSDSDGSVVAWSWDFGDGATSTAQHPSHTYAADDTYTVTLTVTDDDGATDQTSQSVTVSGTTTNSPPTASFTESCTDLTCDFTDTSTDSDGSIASWSWAFGDGATSTAQHPSHTYAAGGTYTVTLTVTDDDGATDQTSQDVTVSDGSAGGITLSATGYKVRGRHHTDLAWSGATSTNVDVYRDGSLIATTANDGAYTDATNNVGGATYTYQVCEAGTTTCSDTVTVVF